MKVPVNEQAPVVRDQITIHADPLFGGLLAPRAGPMTVWRDPGSHGPAIGVKGRPRCRTFVPALGTDHHRSQAVHSWTFTQAEGPDRGGGVGEPRAFP